MSEFHDMEYIGEKIVEMADRVKVMHAAIPGAQAKWIIEMDDVRYQVLVTVDAPSPAPKEADL
jgi:phosphoribosyl-ATP pyrophosphohydrolase